MKQYYMVLDANKIEYWTGDNSKSSFLTTLGYMIIPLGTRKPKNVSRETLKQF